MSDLKYLVLKNEDMSRYLSQWASGGIYYWAEQIARARLDEGKGLNTYLVVNTDEPYAGEVADLIEAHERAKGTWDHGVQSLREVMGIGGSKHE